MKLKTFIAFQGGHAAKFENLNRQTGQDIDIEMNLDKGFVTITFAPLDYMVINLKNLAMYRYEILMEKPVLSLVKNDDYSEVVQITDPS